MDKMTQFISNHLALSLAFIGVLLLVVINELLSGKKKASELSPQNAVNLINHENAVVVDLRDKENFNKGHIIEAVNAKEEDFSTPKMNKYKNKKIILICGNGLQSSTTAAKLRTQGYEPYVLGGGITAWKNADLPLVKSK